MYGNLIKSEIDNVLQSQMIGRLGCCDRNKPYVVPITYVYDGENIFCQSQSGKKINILRKNPNVCLQIDIISGPNSWKSVVVSGKFIELIEAEAKKARDFLYNRVFTLMTESVVHRFEHTDENDELKDENRIKSIMFKINIEEITGRYERL